jgi:hypothetical protein
MTVWRRRTAIQETADLVARSATTRKAPAPTDRMKLPAQATDVADAGNAPDMLGSRRHRLRHRLDPGGANEAEHRMPVFVTFNTRAPSPLTAAYPSIASVPGRCLQRTRDGDCSPPPAQIRTCGFPRTAPTSGE